MWRLCQYQRWHHHVGAGAKPERGQWCGATEEASAMLVEEVGRALTPPLKVDVDVLKSEAKSVCG